MRKSRLAAMFIVLVMSMVFLPQLQAARAEAASAMIEFSISEESVAVSDAFTVVMTVSANDNIDAIDAYVSYDANIIEFMSGGKYVSGSSGLLHVLAEGLGGKKSNVKFSLQFKALAAGNCAVNLSDVAIVKSTSEAMSTSSNRLSVAIKGEAAVPGSSSSPSTISSGASSDNNLSELSVSSGTLDPAFDQSVTKYSLGVSNEVDNLYFSFRASDPDAVVAIEGNQNLVDGSNKVKVIVKAPNKDEKTYAINVKRETAAETAAREAEKNEASGGGIGFDVYNENGNVYIKNQYKFQIVNVDDSELIPTGYTKTSVLLYGVNVSAYTIASDLDNDFLLMYCANEDGNKDFYQFDRQEKSLQRYTGDLVDRVNASGQGASTGDMVTASEYETNLSQMAIIIAILAAFCILLLLCIVSLVLKQIKTKSRKPEDELDF